MSIHSHSFTHRAPIGPIRWGQRPAPSESLGKQDQVVAKPVAVPLAVPEPQAVPKPVAAVKPRAVAEPVAAVKPRAVAEPVAQSPIVESKGLAQMRQLLAKAQQASRGRRPDGRCYAHVWRFMSAVGFGNFPKMGIPDSHATYARQFAELVNRNPARYGLKRLPLSNPYQAPAGSIVVVAPGTPGTRHPRAGDIAVADGRGGFFNGGEMGYGGAGNFPPGNRHVLGVYVPA